MLVRMAITKKTSENKCEWRKGTPYGVGGDINPYRDRDKRKPVWNFLQNLKIEALCDLKILATVNIAQGI